MEASTSPSEALAVQFETHVADAKKHHAEFIGCAANSLKAALLCGQSLIAARSAVDHGDWMKTLKRYWPDISKTTAYRFIGLAENSHLLGNLDMSTQEAYEKLGMVPVAPSEAPETASSAQGSTFTIEAVSPRTKFLTKLSERKDEILCWPAEDRARLEEALKPAVDLYSSLTATKGEVINA